MKLASKHLDTDSSNQESLCNKVGVPVCESDIIYISSSNTSRAPTPTPPHEGGQNADSIHPSDLLQVHLEELSKKLRDISNTDVTDMDDLVTSAVQKFRSEIKNSGTDPTSDEGVQMSVSYSPVEGADAPPPTPDPTENPRNRWNIDNDDITSPSPVACPEIPMSTGSRDTPRKPAIIKSPYTSPPYEMRMLMKSPVFLKNPFTTSFPVHGFTNTQLPNMDMQNMTDIGKDMNPSAASSRSASITSPCTGTNADPTEESSSSTDSNEESDEENLSFKLCKKGRFVPAPGRNPKVAVGGVIIGRCHPDDTRTVDDAKAAVAITSPEAPSSENKHHDAAQKSPNVVTPPVKTHDGNLDAPVSDPPETVDVLYSTLNQVLTEDEQKALEEDLSQVDLDFFSSFVTTECCSDLIRTIDPYSDINPSPRPTVTSLSDIITPPVHTCNAGVQVHSQVSSTECISTSNTAPVSSTVDTNKSGSKPFCEVWANQPEQASKPPSPPPPQQQPTNLRYSDPLYMAPPRSPLVKNIVSKYKNMRRNVPRGKGLGKNIRIRKPTIDTSDLPTIDNKKLSELIDIDTPAPDISMDFHPPDPVTSRPALPGLSIAGLSLPGLSIPGLSLPGLSIPGLITSNVSAGTCRHVTANNVNSRGGHLVTSTEADTTVNSEEPFSAVCANNTSGIVTSGKQSTSAETSTISIVTGDDIITVDESDCDNTTQPRHETPAPLRPSASGSGPCRSPSPRCPSPKPSTSRTNDMRQGDDPGPDDNIILVIKELQSMSDKCMKKDPVKKIGLKYGPRKNPAPQVQIPSSCDDDVPEPWPIESKDQTSESTPENMNYRQYIRNLEKCESKKFKVSQGRMSNTQSEKIFRFTRRSLEYKKFPLKQISEKLFKTEVFKYCSEGSTVEKAILLSFHRSKDVADKVRALQEELTAMPNITFSQTFKCVHSPAQVHPKEYIRDFAAAIKQGVDTLWDMRDPEPTPLYPRHSDYKNILFFAATPPSFLCVARKCLKLAMENKNLIAARPTRILGGTNPIPVYNNTSTDFKKRYIVHSK